MDKQHFYTRSTGPALGNTQPGTIASVLASMQLLSNLKEKELSWSTIPAAANDSLELLDHFVETKVPWIGSPECQRIMQEHAFRLALEAPYLLHAILAFSATHLSFLHPDEKKYGIAAATHYECSLALYSSQLRTGLNGVSADAIFACCHLHSMLAFRNVYLASTELLLDSADGYAHGWLRAIQGTKVLREHSALKPDADQSIWAPVCIEGRAYEDFTFNGELDDTDSTAFMRSKALHQLCDVSMDSRNSVNPYQEPLIQLCRLLRCKIGHGTIGMLMVFIGKLPYSFVKLLDEMDPRAMLIIAHWCALMEKVNQWWISQSAEVECARLCGFLEGLSDSRILDLLPFHQDKLSSNNVGSAYLIS
jgi:hypothetical protein